MKRLAYFVVALIGLTSLAIAFHGYMSRAVPGERISNYILGSLMIFGLGTYVTGLASVMSATTGRSLSELNAYWVAIDKRPLFKCFLSICVFVFLIFVLALPIAIGGALSK